MLLLRTFSLLFLNHFRLGRCTEGEERKLTDFSSALVQYAHPSEGIPHHWFGSSVYVSDGYAIVGASGDGDYTKYGNAYIYKESENTWHEIAKLTSNNPQLDDGFGTAVSIYLSFAFVGAYRDDSNGEDSGCVYYFTAENEWKQKQKLIASDGELLDYFGSSIAQYKRETLLVGAWGVDYGGYTSCGAVYFYRFYDEIWNFEKKMFPHDIHSYQWFGISVTVYQTKAAIGAWGDDEDGSVSGAVYTCAYERQEWIEIQKLTTGIESNHMGYAVHMFEDVLGVGMPNSYRTIQGSDYNPNAFRTGMVAIYRLLDYNHWEFEQYLECNECNDLAAFGNIISVSKENILIGMHGGISLWKYNEHETSGYRWSEEMTVSSFNHDYDSEYFYGSAVSIRNNVILIGIKTADMKIEHGNKVTTGVAECGIAIFFTTPTNEQKQQQQLIQVVDENMKLYVFLYVLISVGLLVLLIGPLVFIFYYVYSEEYNEMTRNHVKKVELKPLVKNHNRMS